MELSITWSKEVQHKELLEVYIVLGSLYKDMYMYLKICYFFDKITLLTTLLSRRPVVFISTTPSFHFKGEATRISLSILDLLKCLI